MANEGETDAPVTAKGKRGRAGTRQVQAVPDAADGAADGGGDASSATALKKKDLLERVMALSKAKKKDVKDVVAIDAMVFAELTHFIADRLQAGTTDLYAEFTAVTEHQLMLHVLQNTSNNLSKAARTLGISRTTLRNKLSSLGITIERSTAVEEEAAAKP